ncbi:MAG: seryl-tRNA synthetase [Candidatus Azotimanducaceae bacterium]|jgi:seryl-tRNA synthetase
MTKAVRCDFDLTKLKAGGVRAIQDGLQTISQNILNVTFDDDTKILSVDVTSDQASEDIKDFIKGMLKTHRLIAQKVLRQNRVADFAGAMTDAELAACPDVQVIGQGLTGLRGPLLKLFRYFERHFASLAADFDAEDNHFPVMIPNETLSEMGYLNNFPQHATFCCHFPDSLPVLEAVAKHAETPDIAQSETDALIAKHLSPPSHVLTPAVCLPCYRQQRDLVIPKGTTRTLTMQNHVFRYEANNFRPLSRGWDFTVRDIVFFGEAEELERLRKKVMDQVFAFCQELDLDVSLELANDPFFLDASRDKAVYQRMGEVKVELLFTLPHRSEPLAASSFNLHRTFYTSIYNTQRAEGGLAESACMGFGLDRWLYGFLSQKGLNPKNWPKTVLDNL